LQQAGRKADETDGADRRRLNACLRVRRQRVEGFKRTGADLKALALCIDHAEIALQQIEQPVVIRPATEQFAIRIACFDIRVAGQVVEFCIAQMAQGQEPAQAGEVGESAFADHGVSLT